MPKLIDSAPRYRRHKATGQAVVRLQGRDVYLGKYNSAASREAYRRFIAQWSQHGGQLPIASHAITVTVLIVSYVGFATQYYRKDGRPTNELRLIQPAMLLAVQVAVRSRPAAAKLCAFSQPSLHWVGRPSDRRSQWQRCRCLFRLAQAVRSAFQSRHDAHVFSIAESLRTERCVVCDCTVVGRLTGGGHHGLAVSPLAVLSGDPLCIRNAWAVRRLRGMGDGIRRELPVDDHRASRLQLRSIRSLDRCLDDNQ